MSAADITRAMLADFDIMQGQGVSKTIPLTMRHQSAALLEGHNLRSVRDQIGYTRDTPDPKPHGHASPHAHRMDQKPRS